MDYLTILATRSLILFPSHTTRNPKMSSPSDDTTPRLPIAHLPAFSPNPDAQTTPTQSHLPPTPISIPIESLFHPDPQLYYFLLSHVLSTYRVPSLAPKGVKTEAEVVVWKELDRGSGFVKALGRWYAQEGGGIGEWELNDLAGRYGLALAGEKEGWIEHHECHNPTDLDGEDEILILA